ncbi:heterokaryon incompatibility protein-domain-containing protein [Immersiella caudata]|uniref:Heterokaryon incompatibility protein-domain-containing protein n=1 Tax=Immersiella caudata TaxID=314043 RepID=A0AA39XJA1_9PEZI|nr:heterokaryon incompatibility protein-domain-containing protein [Immersiella caudata]
MRLINTATHALEYFEGDPPLYVILSHRWGKEEVLFQDIQNGTAKTKSAYSKIERTCALAAQLGIDYAWIDTCCIDKSSSAELSESINSMYRWYEESTICYAYLDDLPTTWIPSGNMLKDYETSDQWLLGQQAIRLNGRDTFQRCKWFTRGWTLQELLAPSAVVFLNSNWEEVGTKLSLWWLITERTGISGAVLHGKDIHSTSVAQRMSWAADRETTRVEDKAYCLLGLFGISMPLLYGERENAFLRLQQEIIRVSSDYSIFAWDLSNLNDVIVGHGNMLAAGPHCFRFGSWSVKCSEESTAAITTNSEGIHLALRLGEPGPGWSHDWLGPVCDAWLPCTHYDKEHGWRPVVLFLSTVGGLYKRVPSLFPPRIQSAYIDKLTKPIQFTNIRASQSNQISSKRQSVLQMVTRDDQVPVLESLLDKGIGKIARKRDCESAMEHAILSGQHRALQVLLEHGLKGENRTDVSKSYLSTLLELGPRDTMFRETTRILIQNGLSPGERESLVISLLLGMRGELNASRRTIVMSIAVALDVEARRNIHGYMQSGKVDIDPERKRIITSILHFSLGF